ncbi:hypothetical protein [Candidatus Kuenenia stuttgartiensis]|uniref:hypothetical protein n=1 Tax=Kuenenia stuttgartiensis TaxID=174633 RepID=UPI001469FC0F|nr:hypothetical protein [Candidatus Kuenenia stuttgartiensis]
MKLGGVERWDKDLYRDLWKGGLKPTWREVKVKNLTMAALRFIIKARGFKGREAIDEKMRFKQVNNFVKALY